MVDKQSGKDRRINKDRRKRGLSSYNGPENRGAQQKRMNKDRRKINNSSLMKKTFSHSNEGRRSGIDQRYFSYADIIPERRSGKDRRGFVYKHTK
jgi:hypothetical protein